MLVMHNDIVGTIDQGHVADLALLNLSLAFDTVDHTTLLSILKSKFSVADQPLAWFHSYLNDHMHIFSTHALRSVPIPRGLCSIVAVLSCNFFISIC